MFIIQCPIVWYSKVCALPSARSSLSLFYMWNKNSKGNSRRSELGVPPCPPGIYGNRDRNGVEITQSLQTQGLWGSSATPWCQTRRELWGHFEHTFRKSAFLPHLPTIHSFVKLNTGLFPLRQTQFVLLSASLLFFAPSVPLGRWVAQPQSEERNHTRSNAPRSCMLVFLQVTAVMCDHKSSLYSGLKYFRW